VKAGAGALQINYDTKTLSVDGQTWKEGDYLSINGTAGAVYPGEIKTAASEIVQVLIEKSLDPKKSETYGMYSTLMNWCSKVAKCTNADCRAGQRVALRRGHRPVPHRAHVLRGRPHRRDARDDPRGQPGGPQSRPREVAALPEGRLVGIFKA
jgi:hypothetical protein